jgi:UDP-N-acetylglucosamine--N-acetylmuramyl-(pentapeptide) pyrophosphoryl-undecaprenol N-acetylglucosamine transferase
MMDLKEYEKWEDGVLQSNFRMVEFSSEMWKLIGAADVVVSRAGASTMTELSGMAKPVVMVPNEELPGRHQVKNAKAYEKAEAAVVVSDSKMMKKPELLLEAIMHLLRSEKDREKLANNLHSFTKDNVAENLAKMVIGVAGQ